MLDDYLDAYNQDLGADSSRSGEPFNYDNFVVLFKMILKNQTTYFREIYNGKEASEIDLGFHLKENNENTKLCFKVYDADSSGYLSFMELKQMLTEMNLHK